MRLDLFLKTSRLVLRRTVARQLCDANRVEINGQAAKSARAVKAGDEITIRRLDRVLQVRVKTVPAAKQVSRAHAPELYEILSDVQIADD
jgi:ribosomal 50S subunit-recycling heat shock protein